MSRPRHSKSRKAHHGIIRLPANPVATTSAAFARTAVPGFLAALVIKDTGSTLRAWTIEPYQIADAYMDSRRTAVGPNGSGSSEVREVCTAIMSKSFESSRAPEPVDRKSTRLNSSHQIIS